MRSYNSRVCGCPEAKPRENRKRGSYAERLTHELAIVYLTYTTQACAVFECVATRGNKKCVLLASERSERDTLSRSSMENAIRIYV